MNFNKINDILDLPKEVGTDIPKITMLGFNEVLIENYKGILEYEDFFVRICTHIGNVNINGFSLKLNQITDEDIKITGKIEKGNMNAGKLEETEGTKSSLSGLFRRIARNESEEKIENIDFECR